MLKIYLCPSKALKHLRSIQVINFGDCLVRPAGAIAIAESVSEGLPILKVREKCTVLLTLANFILKSLYFLLFFLAFPFEIVLLFLLNVLFV